MADEADIEALRAGSIDLVGRDFSSADLPGQSFEDRDFGRAQLTGANLSKAVLRNSSFLGAIINTANFSHADLTNTKWGLGMALNVNFEGADLRGGEFVDLTFHNCNFNRADLRASLFDKSRIREGCTFEGAITDELTLFDGIDISRPIARAEAFRFYEVDRGVLRRKQTLAGEALADTEPRRALSVLTDQALQALKPFEPAREARPAGMGHNNPPEDTPFERSEYDALTAALQDLKVELPKAEPSSEKLRATLGIVTMAAGKTLTWLARKFDLAADEFAKEGGKAIAKWAGWGVIGVTLFDILQRHSESLAAFLNALRPATG